MLQKFLITTENQRPFSIIIRVSPCFAEIQEDILEQEFEPKCA